jgi:hypothetical protein
MGEVTHVGGRYIYLPGYVNKLIWLLDKTNKNPVAAGDKTWDRTYPTSYSEDTVNYAVEHEDQGLFPTFTTVSGPVAAYSTHTSDVIGLYIEGDVVPGGSSFSLPADFNKFRTIEELTINGSTPVTSVNTFMDICTVGKVADAEGAIMLQCGGKTVGIIGPLEDMSTYRRIALMSIPEVGTVFIYKGYTDPPKLTETNQTVPHTVNIDFLTWKATADILWDLRETERALVCEKKAGQIAEQHIKQEELFGAGGGRIEPEDME